MTDEKPPQPRKPRHYNLALGTGQFSDKDSPAKFGFEFDLTPDELEKRMKERWFVDGKSVKK